MRPPDVQGAGVRAWRATRPADLDMKAWHATVAQWVLNCTWAHPAWSWWIIGVVKLTPFTSRRDAMRLRRRETVHQFHGVTERDAGRICDAAVRAISEGMISPDQDYRARWKVMLENTVAHFRSGAHVEH